MKLKNNALQELYDALVSAGVSMFSYADSPVYKAFEECDEKLSESITFERIKKLENDIDIWKRSNEVLLSANTDLASNKRKLEKEIEDLLSRAHHAEDEVEDLKKENGFLKEDISKLKEHISDTCKTLNNVISERDEAKSQLNYYTHSRDNWRARAKYAEDEVERLRKAHDELFDAGSREISELRRENEAVNKKLEKDLVDAKVRLHFLTRSRDDWKSRVEHAEDEVEALKKDNEDLEKRLMETTEAFEKVNSDRSELQKDRDSYHELYTELSKAYDKLSEDNKNLKVRTDCLRKEVEWYRKHYRDQSDKIQELKSRLNSIYGYDDEYIKKLQLQDGAREIGYEQGQTDLWDKLQNVRDVEPEEFDCECETLGDILDMDLEDFLDAYEKWEEEKEKARGCGWSHFTKPDDPCSGSRKKVKEACNAFAEGLKAGLASEVKEVPVSCDIPIKDLGSWECTLEGNVEINKDLLEKVCGVRLEEKKPKPGELVITTHGVVTGNYTEAAVKDIKEAIKNFEKSLPALDSWEATIKGSIKDTE